MNNKKYERQQQQNDFVHYAPDERSVAIHRLNDDYTPHVP
jgi:hypothetical protein